MRPKPDPRTRGFPNRGAGRAPAPRRYLPWILALALLGGYGLWKVRTGGEASAFQALARAGAPRLPDTEAPALTDRSHLPLGREIRYASLPPTSGPHSPLDVGPGFYRERPSFTQLVHSLEHGEVVVYYDRPGPRAIATLKRWARLFEVPFQGVVAVPLAGLGSKVVLTAWGQRLDLAPFDAELAAAFIDRFRGRGPERKVR